MAGDTTSEPVPGSVPAAGGTADGAERAAPAPPLRFPAAFPGPGTPTTTAGLDRHLPCGEGPVTLPDDLPYPPADVLYAVFAVLAHRYDGQETGTLGRGEGDLRTTAHSALSADTSLLDLLTNADATRPGPHDSRRWDNAAVRAAFHHHGEREPAPQTDASALDGVEVLLSARITGSRADLTLHYDSSLFPPRCAARLAANYRTLLASALARPDAPVNALDLVADEEHRDLLEALRTPDLPYQTDTTVHAQVAAQAARTPDAPAVEWRTERISYRQLDARANEMARALRTAGLAPGAAVGVSLRRTAELPVVLLALLKAGCAYVPLDPAYPAGRLSVIAETARLAAVICEDDLASRWSPGADLAKGAADPPPPHLPTLPLSHLTGLARDEPADAPPDRVDPAAVSHIIFTSGSTGRPKGVVVRHRNVVALLAWARATYSPRDTSRVLFSTSLNFDLSVFELWCPLTTGGCLVVAENAFALADTPDLNPTLVNTVPSALTALVRRGALPASVEVVNVAGEPLDKELVNAVFAHSTARRVHNLYGPSEATTYATDKRFDGPTDRTPTIGAPLPNTRAYVLDAHGQLVPRGVVGELYLGGAGLSAGYVNDPERTAAAFVPPPRGIGDTGTLYRTGDLVRWTENGELLFLGRHDDQVKVRGHRIELGEIERALREQPEVAQAAASVWRAGPGDDRLVGHVVPAPGTAPDPAALRDKLARELPPYMLPLVVLTDTLPLGPTGKLDRKALPAPDPAVGAGAGATAVAPRDQLLCRLFADVLALPRVGPDDSLFELGGHSLLALRLISRVKAELGRHIGLADVFDHPTPRALGRRLAAAGGDTGAPLRPLPLPERVPLSHAQRRLWFLDRLEGASPRYHLSFVVRLTGALDHVTLALALQDVVGRHESLRTVYPEVDGEPVQHVLPTGTRPELSVRQVSAADLEAELGAASARTFRLADDLPIRAWLFETSPDTGTLLLVLHHIATDGWSMEPLARDLATAYLARSEGRAPDWPLLPVRYADYTLWQRDLLGDPADPDGTGARQLRYWKQHLAGIPDEIGLPFDRPRPADPSHRGSATAFRIDADVHARLTGLAHRTRTTPFMIYQAGLALLLGKLTGGTDIPLGTLAAGRSDAALDGLVGFFVNTLVLRTDLSGDPTFEELLARIRATDLAAFGHQDVPFEQVVETVNPERSRGRHPLFQVLVTAHSPATDVPLPGLVADAREREFDVAKFDMNVNFHEHHRADGTPGGIEGEVRFSTDLFDLATVETFTERLVRVLTAVADDAHRTLGELDILSPEERHRILVRWNDTARDVPADLLPHLLERQAARTPGAPAVRMGDTSLTYADLNARANRLARRLVARGVGPETMVALRMPRSCDLIVAVWATLKAGGAYVPVDPAYPAERIAFMLADSRPTVVLTEADTSADAPGTPATDLTDADRLSSLRPEHPCYVIYTSGSTGVPKGVVMPGAALVNLMAWYVTWAPSLRVAQYSSISFDVAAMEILIACASGGCLVMPSEETRKDPAQLVAWLAREEVSVLIAPNLVVDTVCEVSRATGTQLPALGLIGQGGEALVLSRDLKDFYRTAPERRLDNYYGPTETHLATAYTLPADPAHWPAEPPIGRPVHNMRAYVLDRWLQPVPSGVVGELYLAGAQLARGYLNRPRLTAERFLPDPFGPPGGRMYRTGDLVRLRDDGQLLFAGRADHQVKVRGFRIETGEIEARLLQHADVAQVAVLPVQDRPGVKRLVAYLVPTATPPEPHELRRHLACSLPDFMVPSAFVPLTRMPLTPNGKLDRAALPAPVDDATGRAPRTWVEKVLCEAFADVLDTPVDSIDQDFFALGGHSMSATRLTSLIRARLRTELPLRVLFEQPTPAGIADFVGAAGRADVESAPTEPATD